MNLFKGVIFEFFLLFLFVSTEDYRQELYDDLLSPFCPGQTLSHCPSVAAVELKERISGWYEGGWTKERVKERLVAVYGNQILGRPQMSGFGIFGWFVPLAFIVIGFFIITKMSKN